MLSLFGTKVKPEFLIVGAEKAATTSLHYYLTQHSQLISPQFKEVPYFWNDAAYSKGDDWYERFFLKFGSKTNDRTIAFDATPANLYLPYVPKRIKKYRSDMKIIILLREPVSRAYSAWNMLKENYDKYHSKSFKVVRLLIPDYIRNSPATQNMKTELFEVPVYPSFEEVVAKEMDKIKNGSSHYEPSFLRRGFYAEQIARYYEHFPKEQILILTNKDLKTDLNNQLNKILNFIDLPNYDWSSLQTQQKNAYQYSEPINADIKAELQAFYEPYNEQLFELLGKEVKW